MKRIALVLSALALAGGISACGGSPRASGNCTWVGDGQTYAHDAKWVCADTANLVGPAGISLSHVKPPANPGNLVCTIVFVAGADPTEIWGTGNAAEATTFCRGSQANSNIHSFTWAAGFGPSASQSAVGGPAPTTATGSAPAGSSADGGSNGSSGGPTAPGFGSTGLPAADAAEYTDGWTAAKGVTEVDVMAAAGQQIPTTYALSLLDANYCTNNDPNGPGGDSYYGGTAVGGSPWFVGCLSELVANPPAAPVITPSSPGYSVGYALGQQNAAAPANNSMTAQEWCDEYGDPGGAYAPQVAGVGTDQNPADDPAVVGCIAGMHSQGVQ